MGATVSIGIDQRCRSNVEYRHDGQTKWALGDDYDGNDDAWSGKPRGWRSVLLLPVRDQGEIYALVFLRFDISVLDDACFLDSGRNWPRISLLMEKTRLDCTIWKSRTFHAALVHLRMAEVLCQLHSHRRRFWRRSSSSSTQLHGSTWRLVVSSSRPTKCKCRTTVPSLYR